MTEKEKGIYKEYMKQLDILADNWNKCNTDKKFCKNFIELEQKVCKINYKYEYKKALKFSKITDKYINMLFDKSNSFKFEV